MTAPGPTPTDPALPDLSRRLWLWLTEAALPLWWRVGADHENGGFHEALAQDGSPVPRPRRCRLHPRHIYAFRLAARLGWDGPAEMAVEHALGHFLTAYRRPDGLFRAAVGIDGRLSDDRAVLYDQAFALLGLHAAHDLEPRPRLRDVAAELLDAVWRDFKHPGGGFRERGEGAPFQSNAQMHLFEACIAWSGVAGGRFADTADEIGELCLGRLIDPGRGVIDEVYDADWRPGGAGQARRIEPGHQFEWAWLLTQWRPGAHGVHPCTEHLFAIGEQAVDPALHVAPGAIGFDGRVTDPIARLWPQTERLRTAALLARRAQTGRSTYGRAAQDAGDAILAYLDTPIRGLWHDKLTPEGAFVDEPAPASTLYHLAGAIGALKALVLDEAPRAQPPAGRREEAG